MSEKTYKLSLKIPAIPDSLNKSLRHNRFKRNNDNKYWDAYIHSLIRLNLPVKPLESAHIQIVRNSHRMLDYDGMVGSMKPVVDALVSCGVLKDDSWKTLGAWTVDQRFRPKKEGPLIEITIEEITKV